MIIVVTGVSGSGKSTVGKLLAARLSIPFLDADDFHPIKNVEKMRLALPLNDEDREPWLASVSAALQGMKGGVVLACSALKEAYRQALQKGLQERVVWMYLEGSEETILKRIQSRSDHFMPGTLLHSQFATLEKPTYGYCFSVEKPPAVIVDEMIKTIDELRITT
ncbi:MAG: hypothetical protein JWQ96_2915 [Segetibacter sp.]|nr:hypothetical protein [Segetibacter sp.]